MQVAIKVPTSNKKIRHSTQLIIKGCPLQFQQFTVGFGLVGGNGGDYIFLTQRRGEVNAEERGGFIELHLIISK